MMPRQQARLGDVVHIDAVVLIRAAVVPDLVGALGVLLPLVSGDTSIEAFKRAAMPIDEHVAVIGA